MGSKNAHTDCTKLGKTGLTNLRRSSVRLPNLSLRFHCDERYPGAAVRTSSSSSTSRR